jgi:hypothetical protein
VYFAGGEALLWKTVWANEDEAADFFEAERRLLEKRHQLTNPRADARSYEADAPRVIRLRQTDAHEVVLIDAARPEWAEALEILR